jgi:hypothetical protein
MKVNEERSGLMFFRKDNQEWIELYSLIILNMLSSIKNIFVESYFLCICNGTLHENDINKYLELEIVFPNQKFNFVFETKIK